jgi:hypothetical protein
MGTIPRVSLELNASRVKNSSTNCDAATPATAHPPLPELNAAEQTPIPRVPRKGPEIDGKTVAIKSENGNKMVRSQPASAHAPWVLLFIKNLGEIWPNQVFTLSPNL